MINWSKGQIQGVILNRLVKHVDNRGYLTELFRADELPEAIKPVMSYLSYTEPGIVRGPHEHVAQTDIFAFAGPGNFLIKLWDNRPGSTTYSLFMEFYGGQDNPITLLVPPGVVHGYKNISRLERGLVINYPDKLFMGWGKQAPVDEIRHENQPDSPFHLEG